MMDKPLPTTLRQFIAGHIQTVEHLDILCLLAEDPSRDWSVLDAHRNIQSTEKSVQEGLQHFVGCNLLAKNKDGTFRFAPGSSELNRATMELIKTYRERRVSVIEAIYRKSKEPVRHFADTFRPGRKK
jgi:hypothetical protein